MSQNGDSPGDSPTERNGDERPETVSIGELLRSTHSISHRSMRHTDLNIAIVQIRAMGTTHVGEDSASSQGLLQRLLSPGSFRLARMPGDVSSTSPRQSGDDYDSTVEDSGPGIQDNDDNDDNDDEDYEMEYSYWGRPFARTPKWFPPVTTPQEQGVKLLMGGEFGRIGVESRSRGEGSANFSRAILSGRSKLRQTPKQDITNVRAVYVLEISLMNVGHHSEHFWYGCLVSSRKHILWSILCRFVRACSFTNSVLYPRCFRLFLLLHVLQR